MEALNDFLGLPELTAVTKNLEVRWGLSVVSFAPDSMTAPIVDLQRRLLAPTSSTRRDIRPWVSLHGPSHFHCTHATLRRSNPEGPVRLIDLAPGRSRLCDLLAAISEAARECEKIDVCFDRVCVGSDGLGLVLLGRTANNSSTIGRRAIMKSIADQRGVFSIEGRGYDREDPSNVHMAVGFIKQQPPGGLEKLASSLDEQSLDLRVTFDNCTIVHHRRRSLEPPQEGSLCFEFGDRSPRKLEPLITALRLAD